jgi:glycosyltransferase involved in cell wall biosynthesis
MVFLVGAAPSVFHFREHLIKQVQSQNIRQTWILDSEYTPTVNMLDSLGVPWAILDIKRGALNPVADLRGLVQLAKTLMSYNENQILVVYHLKLIFYTGMLARVLKCLGLVKSSTPLVAFVPGLGYALSDYEGQSRKQKYVQWISRFVARRSFPAYARIIFTNSDNYEKLLEIKALPNNVRWTVVPGAGVCLDEFPKMPQLLPLDPIVFTFVGRLTRDKGFFVLIEAIKLLNRDRTGSFVVNVVGEIDKDNPTAISQQRLEEELQQLGASVVMLGHRTNMRDVFANTHVGVLPSFHEGRPTAVMEWMACGRAGITTTGAGCRETIEHDKNGFLVKPGSAGELAGAMQRYIDSPELVLRHGDQAHAAAAFHFERGKVVEQTLDFMKGCE